MSSRTEFSSIDVVEEAQPLPSTVVLTDAELATGQVQTYGSEVTDLLPSFLQASSRSLSANWLGDRTLVAQAHGQVRKLRVRRVLVFEDPALARAAFPQAVLAGSSRVTDSGAMEVVSSEMEFSFVPSEDGEAMRIRMDRLLARRPEAEVPQLLPLDKSPLPAVLSLSLRYVSGGEAISHTVVFLDTLDVRAGDHLSSPRSSDWITIVPGVVPHSIQIAAMAREELNAFLKSATSAGQKVYDLARMLRVL